MKKTFELNFILLGETDRGERLLVQSCVCAKQILFIDNYIHPKQDTGGYRRKYEETYLFDVHVTMHHDKFRIIKPTRCTNFSNLYLELNSTCFEQFLCPSSGVFHCTHINGKHDPTQKRGD